MGDDIGWMNVDAYHRRIMEKTNPNLEQLANEGRSSPPITPRPAAPPAAPTSSPTSSRSALA
jgi:hypothetical protein